MERGVTLVERFLVIFLHFCFELYIFAVILINVV